MSKEVAHFKLRNYSKIMKKSNRSRTKRKNKYPIIKKATGLTPMDKLTVLFAFTFL